MPTKRPGNGFTLVELLVCIAVIAVMISMLLPALKKSKYATWQVVCAQAVRSWSAGALTYATDNRQALPYRGPDNSAMLYPNVVGADFQDELEPYGLNAPSAFCPEGAVPNDFKAAFYTTNGGAIAYSYFGYLTYTSRAVWGAGVTSTNSPRSPRTTRDEYDQYYSPSVLFSDVNRYTTTTPTAAGSPIHTNHHEPTGPRTRYLSTAGFYYELSYCRGINNGYLDGHVEWITQQRLNLNRSFYSGTSTTNYSFHWPK